MKKDIPDCEALSSNFDILEFYNPPPAFEALSALSALEALSAFDPLSLDPLSAFYTDFFDFVSSLSYFDFFDFVSFGGLSAAFYFDLLFDFLSLILTFIYLNYMQLQT